MRRRVRSLLSLFFALSIAMAVCLASIGALAQQEGRHPTRSSISPSAFPAKHHAPEPSSSASAPSPASSGPQKAAVEGIVRLKDRKVFSILIDREGHPAADRAREATHALENAFERKDGEARFEKNGEVANVYVGKTPIVELDGDDAEAAGSATLDAYAADVTAKIQAAIAQERKRSVIANTVFSFSLVVFSGLIAFLLLGKASQFGTRAREWVEDNPERIPSLKFGGIELLRPAAIEAALTLGISIAKRIVQFGVLYAWAIFSLSLFESTKGYTDKLTGLVLGPLSGFVTRIGTGLPLAVVTGIAIFATVLLVRFTGVFFAGVARGETSLDWVPPDLAPHVGVIVRIGIIVVALILASPLLTGSEDGTLARAGIATIAAFGLAATPVLACGIVGAIVVFNRRLRPGDFVEIGGRTGRIRSVTLLEVAVEDESGCEVRIPHILGLLHPTRLMGPSPVVSVELVVDPKASQVRVREVLVDAASKVGATPRVDLVSIDIDGALYRVTVGVGPQLVGPIIAPTSKRLRSSSGRSVPPPPAAPRIITLSGTGTGLGTTTTVQLTSLLADTLAREGIALGRRSNYGSRAS